MVETSVPHSWQAGRACAPLAGCLRVPGDKSISHRAVLLAALAEGISRIEGFLEGEDTRATAAIFKQLGVTIHAPAPGVRVVEGVGLHGLKGSAQPLDCGNAGTAMRLLAGVLAGQRFASTLVGDVSLSARPMRRVAEPLARMGARIQPSAQGTAPLVITPATLTGVSIALEVASAQVKSALLLAGLYAQGTTRVEEPHPTRDYTETMLAMFGWPVQYGEGFAQLTGGHALRACEIAVPGDFSSAAFALVAGCVVAGAQIRIEGVELHARRTGLLTALQAMGAHIQVHESALDVHAAPLKGIDVPVHLVPDMIDEFPVLFVAAACAQGITRIRGAAELRVKESDRISRMAQVLRACGVQVDETPDGADIHGCGGHFAHGGVVGTGGDHRIAMAAAVLAQCCEQPIYIQDVANVATSYPGFDAHMRALGFNLHPLN